MSFDRNEQITKNFKMSEFVKPNHNPSAEQLSNIRNLANRLQVIRDFYGMPMTIHEGFRTKEEHIAIYKRLGIPAPSYTYHFDGKAGDFSISSIPNSRIAKDFKFWSGGMGVYNQHIHMDTGPQRRWSGVSA